GSQQLTLSNNGDAALTLNSNIGPAGGDSSAFHSTDNCGSSVSAHSSCHIDVTFGPMPAGSYSSKIQVSSTELGTQTADVSGTSTTPAWQATPSSLAFAPNINTSQQLPVVVKNIGNGDMHIGSVSVSGTDASQFNANTGCTSKTVAPSATCTVQVTFAAQPNAAPRTASLDFTDDAGGPHSVPLTGAAQAPGFGQSPVSLAFPGMQVGIRGSTLVEAITNTGNKPLNLGPVSIGGYNKFAFLKVGDGCSNKILAPNATCNIGVRVAARVAGPQNAFILVPNDAPGTPDAHVLLTGTGLIPRAPAPLTIATGCNSVRLAWGAPVGAYRFLGTRVVRNAARVPRGPLDGVAVPHGPGAALNIRLGTFTTYNYGVWGVYGTWDGSGIHYSKRQARTVRTGRVCSPRNNSVTTDRTPLVTWLPFGSGPADYGFNLVRADHLILQGLPKNPFYQFRSAWTFKGHRYSLGPGVYTMFIFGYNAAHRTGILIGAVTFTVR
ncbi:MAG: choice-of-anchor D domain-containing protein, partial [Gaiellales bacterium]